MTAQPYLGPAFFQKAYGLPLDQAEWLARAVKEDRAHLAVTCPVCGKSELCGHIDRDEETILRAHGLGEIPGARAWKSVEAMRSEGVLA